METEEKIRGRIEAILTSDARSRAEVQQNSCDELPPEMGDFARERDLYRRILNTYRTAISEVNTRLEENTWFLSGLCRVLDNVETPGGFQQICLSAINVALNEFGAEYCGLSVAATGRSADGALFLEGSRDGGNFGRIHSGPQMAGSAALAEILRGIAEEAPGGSVIGDVYRDPRFNSVDLPSVFRSLACVPIRMWDSTIGFMALAHSLPHHFSEDQARVFRVLTGLLAHLWRFAAAEGDPVGIRPPPSPPTGESGEGDELSVLMLDFELAGPVGYRHPLDTESVLSIKRHLRSQLSQGECILLYGEQELLVLLPGTSAAQLPERIRLLQNDFREWQKGQDGRNSAARMNVGYSSCGSDSDLSTTLEAAASAVRQEQL